MATGQVGFYHPKQVKKIHVEKRINEIINRLNKTKIEKSPDLVAEKAAFEKEERRKEKVALEEKVFTVARCTYTERAQRKEEERAAKEKKEKAEKDKKTYEDMYGREAMQRTMENRNEDYDPEEDFW